MNNRFLKISLILMIILIVLSGALYAVLNTQYARDYISGTIESIVNTSIDQEFSIGEIRGNLFKGFELSDVRIDVDGETFLNIDKLSTNYSLPLLVSVVLRGDIPLYNTQATGIEVNLIKYENGVWNFNRLRDPDEDKSPGTEGKDGKKGNLINLYLKDAKIDDSFVKIINREKDSEIEFRIGKSEFSIDLIGIHRKFLLDSRDINLDIEPFGIELQHVSTNALITKDNVAFKNLDLTLNDTHIQGQGVINDYGNPTFNINAYIDSFSPSDLGVFNMYIKTSGKSWEYKRFDAQAEVSLLNSSIRGRRIWTDLGKIDIKDTRAFINGDINTEFGSANLDGYLDLKKLLQNEGSNEFNFDTQISGLDLNELLKVLEISTKDIRLANENTIKSDFKASGNWTIGSDFSTNINFSALKLTEGIAEKLSLTGQTLVNKNRIDLDIQSRVRNLDLSQILNDFDSQTDINTDISFYGTIPLKGEFLKNLEFSTDSELYTSTVNSLTIDEAVVDANYSKGILNVNELEVLSSDLVLSVEGRGSRENGLDLIYKAKSANLDFLNSLLSDTGLSGSIETDGTVIGDIENPQLTTVGTFENLKFRDLIYARSGDFNIKGSINRDMEGLDLTSNLKNIRLGGKRIELLQLLASKEEEGIVSNITTIMPDDRTIVASVTIDNLLDTNKSLRFNSLDISLKDENKITTDPFLVKINPDRIVFDKPVFYFKEGLLEVDGYYSFKNALNLRVGIKEIDNSLFSLISNSGKSYSGTTSGQISLTGTTGNPVMEADIISANPGYGGYNLDTMSLNVNARNRNIDIDMSSSGTEAGTLNLKGDIKTGLDLSEISENMSNADLNLDLSSSDFSIGILKHFVDEITEIKGSLNTELRLRGKISDPKINGDINITESELRLKSLSNTLTFDKLTISGNRDSAIIRPTIIRSGEGQAELTGELNLSDHTFNLLLDLDKLLIKPKFITANASGSLRITGDEDNRIMIEGDIISNNTRIIIIDKQTRDTSEIKFVDESEEPEEFILSDDDDESFYKTNVALDLDVNVPRDSWVKGKGANIEITGDINVDKEYYETHYITGNIDVLRGQYILFGKLFKIDDGSITFPADGTLTPLLNLNVSYNISNVVVYINVRGRADKPELDLSSSPPMEESEIISYVLFGTSRNNLGNEQRNVAGEIASNIAAGEVASFIGGRFGLDVFSVQGGEEGGLSDPQIRAGSYINPDIYIGYERSSSTYPGSENTTSNSFIMEWKINESFSLETQVGGENSGVDIFYNFNF